MSEQSTERGGAIPRGAPRNRHRLALSAHGSRLPAAQAFATYNEVVHSLRVEDTGYNASQAPHLQAAQPGSAGASALPVWRLETRRDERSDMMAEVSRPTVLVVDDDPSIRESLRFLFDEAAYEVVEAFDGFTAL